MKWLNVPFWQTLEFENFDFSSAALYQFVSFLTQYCQCPSPIILVHLQNTWLSCWRNTVQNVRNYICFIAGWNNIAVLCHKVG